MAVGGGEGGGRLLVSMVQVLEQNKNKNTMRTCTFFQAVQCAALSSFRVRKMVF